MTPTADPPSDAVRSSLAPIASTSQPASSAVEPVPIAIPEAMRPSSALVVPRSSWIKGNKTPRPQRNSAKGMMATRHRATTTQP